MFYVLVILLTAGAAVGFLQDRRHLAWGRPLLIACTVLLFIACLWQIFSPAADERARDLARRFVSQHAAYAGVATEKLGRVLAERHPKAKALVILPIPFTQRPDVRDALVEGLDRGFDSQIEILEKHNPPLPPGYAQLDPEKVTSGELENLPPANSLLTAEHVDALVRRHAGQCSLVVFLTWVPSAEVELITFWAEAKPPTVALFGGMPARIQPLVAQGRIDVAILKKKQAIYDPSPLPDDLDAAFDRRFELVEAKSR